MKESYEDIRKFLDNTGVTLVAISKTKTPKEIMAVYSNGQRIFGENKVQELVQKKEMLPKDIEWHLVGHLQSNKVKLIAPFASLIHSVESLRLLEEINRQAGKCKRVLNVLLQVYIAQEETKFGLTFNEARSIVESEMLQSLQHVFIRGVMGMATFTENETQIRSEFRSLKSFYEEMKKHQTSNCDMQILSMGMSADYRIAVEEGSTMVRIGSAIFGERN